MSDPILILPEVAVVLKVDKETLNKTDPGGQIPAFKVRAQWRFKHDGIDRWIDEQKTSVMENLRKGAVDV